MSLLNIFQTSVRQGILLKSINGCCTKHILKNIYHTMNPAISSQNLSKPLLQLQKQLNSKRSFHDHAKLWKLEKGISVSLLGLIPCILVIDNTIIETVTSVFTVMHMYWGYIHIQSDYLRKNVIGAGPEKLVIAAIWLLCLATLAGLLNVSYNHGGIGTNLKIIWTS